MTNQEYLQSIADVDSSVIEAILSSRGVSPTDSFSISKGMDLATADLYMRIIVMPEFSEGDLSIKYNAEQLEKLANNIYYKYNDANYIESIKPTIRGIKW